MTTPTKRGVLCLETWAGRREHPIEVIGETPKRYRIRALVAFGLPSGHRLEPGGVALVPKTAIRITAERGTE